MRVGAEHVRVPSDSKINMEMRMFIPGIEIE